MKKKTKIILELLPLVFFLIAVLLIIQIVVAIRQDRQPSLFGYSINYVLTPSMEPTILAGDLVLMKSIKPHELKKEDIVNFTAVVDNKTQSFTHRIVSIEPFGNTFLVTTKGDNNSSSFSWETNMNANQIVSVFVAKSTFLGSIYRFLFEQGIQYIYLTVILLFVSIALLEFRNLLKQYKEYQLAKYEQQKQALIDQEVIRLRAEQESTKAEKP